eukprot:1918004-Rhodomonas_salina.2
MPKSVLRPSDAIHAFFLMNSPLHRAQIQLSSGTPRGKLAAARAPVLVEVDGEHFRGEEGRHRHRVPLCSMQATRMSTVAATIKHAAAQQIAERV